MNTLKGRSGYTTFGDIEPGTYFFFLGSTVPHYKYEDGFAVQCGTAVHLPLPDNSEVVPVAFVDGVLTVGHYRVPMRPETAEEQGEREIKASLHEAYRQQRLAAERGTKPLFRTEDDGK